MLDPVRTLALLDPVRMVALGLRGRGWPLFQGRESVSRHGQILWGLVVGRQVCLMMGGLDVEVH